MRTKSAVALLWLSALLFAAGVPGCHQSDATADPDAREIWEAFYLAGAKIGYGRTTERHVHRGGRALVEIESLNHLAISRFGQSTEQDVLMSTLETPEGELVEFHTKLTSGPAPATVTGRVDGAEMVIDLETKGRRESSRIPWASDIRGFLAIEQSLEERPLEPGQERTLRMFVPLVNQVADVQLVAGDYETTSVLDVERRLLRIESVANLPGGQRLASVIWTDADGQTMKSRIEALKQESFRTSRAVALAPADAVAKFDLGSDLIVKIERPKIDLHHAPSVRYRVELTGENPARVFATGPTQSVRPLGEHVAEVTVRSLRPADLAEATTEPAVVGQEYLAANSILQIDDPRVRQMAQEARGDATRPADVALAVERYVHDTVTKKNFSQAFSTAAEVAQSREGDCTEHAVLLAAIGRACGIPSRVAIGLVYVESAGGFGYHMWTEMWLSGQWIPLDAIMGQGGVGAAHLKLTDSSLEGATAFSSFLPVTQVVGQLKIGVIE